MPAYIYTSNEITIIDDSKFHRTLCFIKFHVNSNVLTIENIETTSFGKLYTAAHFGSSIFNALLLYLHNNNIIFDAIEGKLSTEDARRKNWLNSIPFYNNFPNWLDGNLPYTLTVSFYTDKSCTTQIIFENINPTYSELIKLIEKYENSKVDAFFVFQVKRI